MLDNSRFSTREIAQSPVTDPRILQVNAGRFDGAEFSNRSLDVALIIPGLGRDGPGIHETPAAVLDHDTILLLVRGEAKRKLERRRDMARQIEERKKTGSFIVNVYLLAVLNPFVAGPMRDGAEGGIGCECNNWPKVQGDAWRGVSPWEPHIRASATCPSHGFTSREV
jgi:hypothetical protein